MNGCNFKAMAGIAFPCWFRGCMQFFPLKYLRNTLKMKVFFLVVSKINLYAWETKHNKRTLSIILPARNINKPFSAILLQNELST